MAGELAYFIPSSEYVHGHAIMAARDSPIVAVAAVRIRKLV